MGTALATDAHENAAQATPFLTFLHFSCSYFNVSSFVCAAMTSVVEIPLFFNKASALIRNIQYPLKHLSYGKSMCAQLQICINCVMETLW